MFFIGAKVRIFFELEKGSFYFARKSVGEMVKKRAHTLARPFCVVRFGLTTFAVIIWHIRTTCRKQLRGLVEVDYFDFGLFVRTFCYFLIFH